MLKKLLSVDAASTNPSNGDTPAIKKINQRDIAVIGISLEFPLAKGTDQFWANLASGRDCMRTIPAARLADLKRYFAFKGVPLDEAAMQKDEAAFLDELDKFDYGFFRLSPNEARLMDPNQRMFLQTAWAAIEDAGYGGERLKGSQTGVFVGFSSEAEYKRMITDWDAAELSAAMTGNLNSMLPSRISYLLNLQGPSMVIDTSCSSSLVAVHLACQSIRNNECDLALAGGVQTHLIPIRQTKVGIESSNHRTCTFDDGSDGTGTGEGVAAILLKPLHKALKDRDPVYAVIKGSAINQDGNSVGLTAPNVAAQTDVIVRAWRDADVDPATITYIEAHGTGTKLGDPIEIEGIRRAFAQYTDRKQFCAVSSVKSNMGHLDQSAGIAGLIKAILALQHKQLPPSLHVRRTNRNISFEDSPVYVNDRLTEWASEGPRKCGVSSFGMSGTNCHIVLEEAPASRPTAASGEPQLLTLSARSLPALRSAVANLRTWLDRHVDVSLTDLCMTANTGRSHWEVRLALLVETIGDLSRKLDVLAGQADWTALELDGAYHGECKLNAAAEKVTLSAGYADWEELGRRYVSGADVDWESWYAGKPGRRLPLPAYPFERKRCWIDFPETGLPMVYAARWESIGLPVRSGPLSPQRAIVVVHDQSQQAEELLEQLRQRSGRVIEVLAGDRFEQTKDGRFTVGSSEEDYRQLLDSVELSGVDRIVHALNLNPQAAADDETQQAGFYHLFHLAKALGATAAGNSSAQLVVLTSYAQHVQEDQPYVQPFRAALAGLAKSLHWEQPALRCRCIDVDQSVSPRLIADELEAGDFEFLVAYRAGERLVERLAALEESNLASERVAWRAGGTYVISGGLGNLGLQMARYAASKQNVNLILLGRSALPPRAEWEDQLVQGADAKRRKQIEAIRHIEAMGSKVFTYQADVSNADELEAVLADVRRMCGGISGMIHCAGIGVGMSGVPVRDDKQATYEAVLAPKVQGTWNLLRATQQDEPDFMLLFSSTITWIGSVGGGSYTAANAFLDAFPAYASRCGRRALTVNWPYWLEEGQDNHHSDHKELFHFLKPDEAFLALDKVLPARVERVTIGSLNEQSQLLQLGDHLPLKLSAELLDRLPKAPAARKGAPASAKRSSVKVKDSTNSQTAHAEKEIALIWHEVLGFDEFSVEDNFFDIGGDSILITKVHAQLAAAYGDAVRMADLFAFPTIAKLAAFIVSLQSAEESGAGDIRGSILQLLQHMEQGTMTLEEAVLEYHLLEVGT